MILESLRGKPTLVNPETQPLGSGSFWSCCWMSIFVSPKKKAQPTVVL
jgi:hypothetical protein